MFGIFCAVVGSQRYCSQLCLFGVFLYPPKASPPPAPLFLQDLRYDKMLFANYMWFTYGQEKPNTSELLWWKDTHRISEAAVGQLVGFFVILGFYTFSKV